MAGEVIANIGLQVSEAYKLFISSLGSFGPFINILMLVLLVVLYSVFIWKFYKFVSEKDFLELNLNQYNYSGNTFFTHLLAGLFYFLEYLLLSPFLIFFWFAIFTFFLIVMTEGNTISGVLVISTVIVSAIRITAYYNEDLAEDLAKLLPLNLLAFALANPKFFELGRIFEGFAEIPAFFNNVLYYLLFIIILEILLRFFDFVVSLFSAEEE